MEDLFSTPLGNIPEPGKYHYQTRSAKKKLFQELEENPNTKYRQSTASRTNYNLPVNNRYETLEGLDENDKELDDTLNTIITQNTSQSTPTNFDKLKNANLLPTHKTKPIIIKQYGEDMKKVGFRCQAVCQKKITLKYLGDRISVKTANIDDFHALKKFLETSNIPHHTYTLDHEKTMTAILKGLPPTFTPNDVLEEIKIHNNSEPISCSLIKTRNEKYPIYMVKFPQGTSFNEILKMNSLAYIRVYWEKYKPKNKITQCYNCQQYGHGSRNCTLPSKCLKCGLDHRSRDCTKSTDTPPKCANCNEAHLSNSKNCKEYEKYHGKINKNKDKRVENLQTKLQNYEQEFPTGLIQENKNNDRPKKAWPRTHENRNQNTNEFIELQQVLKEINEICNIQELLNKAKSVLSKLKDAKTPKDKMIAMFELIKDD